MKFTIRLAVLFTVVAGFLYACKPDPVDPEPTPTTPTNPNPNPNIPTGNAIAISFENYVGAAPLTLGTTIQYQNLNGDSFCIETYKYYISNISFTDNLGNTWYENESYHLIDAEDTNSLTIYIDSMPLGTYTSINFMIGVDSARNVSGAQTGALDPANGMFWTWNSGYIMAKIEGRSPSSTQSFNFMIYHIAGFSGQYASQRWVAPSFGPYSAVVVANNVPTIHMKSDILEWFQTPYVIDVSSVSVLNTAGQQAMDFADNYSDMFTVTSIVN